VDIHVDLAELRGYAYHTGVMFAAYAPGAGRAVAWGGRYDNVGRGFGRSRPATGFSTDLKRLVTLNCLVGAPAAIYAPAGSEPDLIAEIERYRSAGEVVIQALDGQTGGAADLGCGRMLIKDGPRWTMAAVERRIEGRDLG
jgi:ATP phosphoribosyltransferase regulatory subunit